MKRTCTCYNILAVYVRKDVENPIYMQILAGNPRARNPQSAIEMTPCLRAMSASSSALNRKVLFVCVGVLRPSQQRGHVELVS